MAVAPAIRTLARILSARIGPERDARDQGLSPRKRGVGRGGFPIERTGGNVGSLVPQSSSIACSLLKRCAHVSLLMLDDLTSVIFADWSRGTPGALMLECGAVPELASRHGLPRAKRLLASEPWQT